MKHNLSRFGVPFLVVLAIAETSGFAQTLEDRLKAEGIASLVEAARRDGDARRGAIAFHQAHIGCSKCHSVDGRSSALGPDLTKPAEHPAAADEYTDEYIVQSLLDPSAVIRKGYESVAVLTTDGRTITGLQVPSDAAIKTIRDPASGRIIEIAADDIDDVVKSPLSIMPAGVINLLGGRQQALDLMRYVIELRDGGLARAAELQPPAALIAFTVPEYESHVDHAGLISRLDDTAFERGAAIYERLCINCHGTVDKEGSLPTALRFASGTFRNGKDPFAMYQTLTHGFGLMVPQTWMVPRQKYDVIHYVREALIHEHNASQFFPVNEDYLATLPKGGTFGPEPVEYRPWSDMDYGPWLFGTYETGRDGSNIAYKGLAVRLDPGPGGVAHGNVWTVFDHDTMRIAAAWTHRDNARERFIDWHGIHFDGRHAMHPRISGDVQFSNPTGPGWANPRTGSFDDDQRVVGRDDRRYGPLPKWWCDYKGMHRVGDQAIVSYSVSGMEVLEQFNLLPNRDSRQVRPEDDRNPVELTHVDSAVHPSAVITRTLELGPSEQSHTLLLATADRDDFQLTRHSDQNVVWSPVATATTPPIDAPERLGQFNGRRWLQVNNATLLDTRATFTLTARIRTKADGVIFSNTTAGDEWVPNGTTLFVRGGRLTYDMGWVGAVSSGRDIVDGQWHDIAVTWLRKSGAVNLYVDGLPVGSGQLKSKKPLDDAVFRIGYCAPDFPADPAFVGDIRDVRFYQRHASERDVRTGRLPDDQLVGHWLPTDAAADDAPRLASPLAADASRHGHDALVAADSRTNSRLPGIIAGITGDCDGIKFRLDGRRLCLTIPASQQRRRIRVSLTRRDDSADVSSVIADANSAANESPRSLSQLLNQPSRPLWPEILTTTADVDPSAVNGFSVDTLTAPSQNPWLARLRFGGHDFFADGDRMAVCSWDGDVWQISGLLQLDADQPTVPLTWQRIASGLFQPLGVKIVNDMIHLTCRDQIVVLRDNNHDGETDVYECFNNDQQVTEHFHEFAMGLQRDTDGNFYYAKSARHALTAVVPHHGTLLRVAPDGSRTDIVAVGFRAANGVCLNADGTFIVTDQEGHWNPKNRINWVREGGFYGNMFGYHDITDDSNSAMQQPLCWITNAFDRSPAELLWVDSDRWGNLNGQLLNLSYGYGKVYVVPHEPLSGSNPVQGGLCEIPIPQFPTGTMRGRFHPVDGQLYLSGLFAWGSAQQATDGGLFRLRYSGHGADLPVNIAARANSLSVTFSDAVDAVDATNPQNYEFRTWSLKRTANYGSKHFDETDHEIHSAAVSADDRTITLTIPNLEPTWCYELRCRLKSADGNLIDRVIHGTIHETQ